MRRVLVVMYVLIAFLFTVRVVWPAGDAGVLLWLCFSPLALTTLARQRVSAALFLVLACALLVPLMALLDSPFATLTALVLVQAAAYLVVQERPRAQGALLVLGPTYAAMEMARDPSALVAGLFLATLALALAGANLLSALFPEVRGENRMSRGGAGYMVAYGAVAALLIVVALPFLSLPLLALPEPILSARADADDQRDPRVGLEARAGAAATVNEGTDVRLKGRFPGSLHLAGQVTRLRHEVVARIAARPVGGGEASWVGPLYLRGLVLDRIEDERVLASEGHGVWVNDGDDGKRDGLILFDAAEGKGPTPHFELSVRQQALRQTGTEHAILFTPATLMAIDRERVWRDPDGVLLLEDDGDAQWLEFAVVVGAQELAPDSVALVTIDERWLQLPEAPVVARLAAGARELTRGATTTLERVERVLAEYHSFSYDVTATGIPGVRGLSEFLQRRRGYCSYFAVASMIQLRSLGIPTRIATGFLGDEYSAERREYVVDTRDGHAWIEVGLEGAGWVPFDPTPRTARERALTRAEARTGFVGWIGSVAQDVGRWFTQGDRPALARLGETLASVPVSSDSGPSAVLVGGLVVSVCFAISIWIRRRLRRRTSPARLERVATNAESGSYLERLLVALARLGHAPQPGETPRRFAHRAAGGVPVSPALAQVPWVVELFYRERFGSRAPAASERACVEATLEELVRADEKNLSTTVGETAIRERF